MTLKAPFPPETGRLLFRHLAAAVRNHASLPDVLKLLAQDSEATGRSAAMLKQLAENQTVDSPLSDRLAGVDGLFAPETIALIRHAEKTKRLPAVLDALASDYQRRHLSQVATKDALIWPLTIAFVLAAVAFVVLIFAVPAFKQVYSSFGADLPEPTLFLIGFSDLLVEVWWLLALVVLAAFIAYRLNRIPQKIIDGLWSACLSIPVIKTYFVRAFGARLANWLHTLNGDREGLAAAVLHLGATSRAPLLRHCASTLAERLGKETNLSLALEDIQPSPKGLLFAARLGEVSGDLSSALTLGLELADEQAISATHRLGRWLFIASYIGVGVLSALFVIAIYLPIFKLGSVV